MPESFTNGDTVYLKSANAPAMTVFDVQSALVYCSWFTSGALVGFAWFPAISLTHIAPTQSGQPTFIFNAENKDSFVIPAGGVCAVHPSGTGIRLACAADTTKAAIGLMQTLTAPTFAGNVQLDGLFQLADWSGIVGTVTLAALAIYFLDPVNPGRLITPGPVQQGQSSQIVGVTFAPDTLKIQINLPILL